MNGMLLLDKYSEEVAEQLAPFTNIFDFNSIESPSPIMGLPKPVVSSISNWLEGERYPKEQIRKNMEQFT